MNINLGELYRFSIILFSCLVYSCDHIKCVNKIKLEVLSPNKINRAVIFSRDCDSTVNFNSQLTVLVNGENFKNEPGNAFIMDEGILDLVWQDDTHIIVVISADQRIYKQVTSVNGVVIIYKFISSRN
jgi:hypothetical protein